MVAGEWENPQKKSFKNRFLLLARRKKSLKLFKEKIYLSTNTKKIFLRNSTMLRISSFSPTKMSIEQIFRRKKSHLEVTRHTHEQRAFLIFGMMTHSEL